MLVLPCCIMLGRAPGSQPFIILMANWLLEGNFRQKWVKLKATPLYWVLTSLFFMSLLGMLYSSDMGWAGNMIQVNLPLLVFPLVMFSSEPLTKKELTIALWFFLLGCFLNTAWCLVYGFLLHHNEAIRSASRFMSHIRLGLYLNLAIATCTYLASELKSPRKRILLISLALYFIAMMLVLGLASGLVNFLILVLAGLCFFIYRQNNVVRIAAIAAVVAGGWILKSYIISVKDEQLQVTDKAYNTMHRVNAAGRPLISFDTLGQKENGNYILINIQMEDLRKAWNKRVPEDSFSYDPKHNLNRYDVLLRYLSSKAETKDAEGVAKLDEEDIRHIRNGITNYRYPQWNYLHKRLYELVNEYDDLDHRRDVNGHSLTMRGYYWQAALDVISRNPLIGVGTGDTQPELNKVYRDKFPELNPEWYKRPHNQLLSMAVCYGIIGLILFLFVLIYPVVTLRRWLPPLYWVFFTLLCVSFITEDTLESQAGIGFYAIFNVLFCADAWFRKQQTPAH